MEGQDLEDSMDESVMDKSTDTSQTQQASGQPKLYNRWTVKGYSQEKNKHSLPDGWCEVFHTSGFPIYFHKQTRVVTLSRPYFLGSVSVRHHLIPVASIPCLYLKQLQEEQTGSEESSTANDESKCPFKNEQQENSSNSVSDRKRKRSEEDVEEGEISSPRASTGANLEESSPSEQTTVESTNNIPPDTIVKRSTKPQPLPVSLQILSNSTLDDTLRYRTLTSDEFRSYCQRRLAFEPGEFKFFPSLSDKWKYIRQAQMKRREMNIPANTQVLELQPLSSSSSTTNDQSVIVATTIKPAKPPVKPLIKSASESSNLNNKKVTIDLYPSKSPIALLQEYALKRLQLSVRYDWFTTDVSNSPFGCRVLVGNNIYGTGIGRNKRTAKLNATEESLVILVPQYKKLQEQQQQQQQQQQAINRDILIADGSMDEEGCIDDEEPPSSVHNNNHNNNNNNNNNNTNNNNDSNEQEPVTSTLLDEYGISDANVYDVCVSLGKPTPYQMLEKSLTYNVLSRSECDIKEIMTKKPMFTHITLEIGNEHREEAQAKDKAHAKNLAAQKLLKKLHPHLHTYGSLIRLYEKNADTYKRVRVDDELADIVRCAKKNEPNHALLAKLREEMLKLKASKTPSSFNQYAMHIVDVNDDLLGRSSAT
ncbi:unnamed protein product [Rotaria socialis]|uniref:Uncharacterized protein n=1 Tax=Rotaria socialis TaxID=392032 RepID=A0A818F515_9BILA|nr:unnamed protein product [Rotaria socialis]CAF3469329.1 unnamed protein product [Rotaria socialis]CAF3511128.1 unnamed protein product [Rotaria socialis]